MELFEEIEILMYMVYSMHEIVNLKYVLKKASMLNNASFQRYLNPI